MRKYLVNLATPPGWGIVVLLTSLLSDTPNTVIYTSLLFHFFFLFKIFPKGKKTKKLFIISTVLLSTTLVISHFKTIFDLEAGISLLSLLLSAKIFELKSKRDKAIYYYIGFLVIAGITIFNQSFYASIFCIILLSLGVWGHTMLNNADNYIIELSGVSNKNLFLYGFIASSILVVCYLLFPRINFGFNNNSKLLGKSNFTPNASPGEVDQLILSDEPVFVAKIKNHKPKAESLYWVGTVLSRTDGYFWREDMRLTRSSPPKSLEKRKEFEIQLRGQNNEYLFTPDISLGPPDILEPYRVLNAKTFKLRRATHKKVGYGGTYTNKAKWDPPQLKYYEKKPDYLKASPKVYQLADQLSGTSADQAAANILKFFTQEKFSYSLKSGRTDTLDDFLFKTKIGFCTHYASAAAVLLRLNNIPSRVITGFQGGEYNSFGNFYTITGKDAHAWVEYYTEEKGWRRCDPVGIISPERIQLGGQNYFSLERDAGGKAIQNENWFSHRYKLATMFIESLNNDWQRFFYEYDQIKQFELAKSLGLYLSQLYYFGGAAISFLMIVIILLQLTNKKQKIDPVNIKFNKLIQLANKKKIKKYKYETNAEFLNKLSSSYPQESNQDLKELKKLYYQYQYAQKPDLEQELIQLIKQCIKKI